MKAERPAANLAEIEKAASGDGVGNIRPMDTPLFWPDRGGGVPGGGGNGGRLATLGEVF